jgi:hypothetical protein
MRKLSDNTPTTACTPIRIISQFSSTCEHLLGSWETVKLFAIDTPRREEGSDGDAREGTVKVGPSCNRISLASLNLN